MGRAKQVDEYDAKTGQYVLQEVERWILIYLKRGLTSAQVSKRLKKKGIKPNSIPTVDTRLSKLRGIYGCKSSFQLAYKLGKKRII